MSPEKRTAFLVIHGVGPHTHFQACNSFIQGFCAEFINKHGKIKAKHSIKQRKDWLGLGIPWIQNYVSLSVPEKEAIICGENCN